MKPCTTFAGPSPFGEYTPPTAEEKTAAGKRRYQWSLLSPPVQRTYNAIVDTPGVTCGDLIKITKNQSSAEYVKSLVAAGRVKAVYMRTKPCQQLKGVRHFYPVEEFA